MYIKYLAIIFLAGSLLSCEASSNSSEPAGSDNSKPATKDVIADDSKTEEVKLEEGSIYNPVNGKKEFFSLNYINSTLDSLIKNNDPISLEALFGIVYKYFKSVDYTQIQNQESQKSTFTIKENVALLAITGMLDDSIEGEQFMVDATYNGLKWNINTIAENNRCRKDRGHTDWGVGMCK